MRSTCKPDAPNCNNSQTPNRFVSTDLIMKNLLQREPQNLWKPDLWQETRKKCTCQWTSHAFRFTKRFSDFNLEIHYFNDICFVCYFKKKTLMGITVTDRLERFMSKIDINCQPSLITMSMTLGGVNLISLYASLGCWNQYHSKHISIFRRSYTYHNKRYIKYSKT